MEDARLVEEEENCEEKVTSLPLHHSGWRVEMVTHWDERLQRVEPRRERILEI